MADICAMTATGRLTKDIEYADRKDGGRLAFFTVAVNRIGPGRVQETLFLNCAVGPPMSAILEKAESFVKGRRVLVRGDYRCREYTSRSGHKGLNYTLWLSHLPELMDYKPEIDRLTHSCDASDAEFADVQIPEVPF